VYGEVYCPSTASPHALVPLLVLVLVLVLLLCTAYCRYCYCYSPLVPQNKVRHRALLRNTALSPPRRWGTRRLARGACTRLAPHTIP
jgi:hypothetical protein